MSNIIRFPTVPTADDFMLFAFREALIAILVEAKDLEKARRLATEALGTACRGDAA